MSKKKSEHLGKEDKSTFSILFGALSLQLQCNGMQILYKE